MLDENSSKCAKYHYDKHVVKMILEYGQLLSTSLRLTNGKPSSYNAKFLLLEGESLMLDYDNKPYIVGKKAYNSTHINHPCNLWVRESLDNWIWLKELYEELHKEWKFRYNHPLEHNHASYNLIHNLEIPNLPSKGITNFKGCFNEGYDKFTSTVEKI